MKLIITADWHLRRDVPRCRLQTQDEWLETQRQQVRFVVKQARKRLCPLVICGDLFDSPVVHPIISNMLKEELGNQETYVIAGNHDTPFHNADLLHQASIWPFINVPEGGAHFGKDPGDGGIIFTHTLVFPDEKSMPPHCAGQTAHELMDKYPQASWIFTGDNHHAFHVYRNGQMVVNPGSVNRQTADMIEEKPCCYFVDTEDAVIEIFIPDPAELVTDTYLKTEKEREGRIEAFIEKLQSKAEVTLDFKENLRQRMKKPACKPLIPIVEKITKKAGMIF